MTNKHMSKKDTVRLDGLLQAHGAKHCKAILTRKSDDKFGLGAVFIAKYKGATWGITCKHVALSGLGIIFGSKKTPGPVPVGPPRQGRNIAKDEIFISDDFDVAVFRVSETEADEISKTPFVLDGRIRIPIEYRPKLIGVAIGCSG